MRTLLPLWVCCWLSLALPAGAAIELAAGSFTLSFDGDGRPAACHRKTDGAELVRAGNGGQGFYLKAADTPPVRLNQLRLQPDGRLLAHSDDGSRAVLFHVTSGQRHIALRIERVTGVLPERLEELHFEINSDPCLRALDLDYMTQADNWDYGVRVAWPAFWHRSAPNPLGGFALYEKTDERDEDDTLLQLWVQEKLPHPKVAGPWTMERARQWIEQWQRRFAVRDQLILAGRSIAELHEGVEFARRAGLKQIYLFTDTWRTDPFWPSTDLNWGVNRTVFPRGEADLRDFSDFVRSQGMYLALHYVSGGIGLHDPLYVGQKPDRRFASWGGGCLAREVGASDATIVLQPAPGVVPPGQHRPAYPHFEEWNLLRIDEELVRCGTIEPGPDGTWTLSRCQRGQGSTKAAAHTGGVEVAGLLLAYGQNLVPDNDSSLLDEIAQNYAGLLNRCRVDHAEFDGAEIHAHDGRWGYLKLATRVYETLDHPTTSHDSSGRQASAWFEYRLNSSQRLMRGSCAYTHGNYSVPVTLATPSRPATTLLDAHFTLSQGNYGGALGLCKPEPMFGVSPQVLEAHGLTGQFIEALQAWRDLSSRLTDEQRKRINGTFAQPRGDGARFNRHLCSPVVWVARELAGGKGELIPTRVLTRKTGDILWQHGQEHGAISPRQFIKPGETLALENPESAQPLQFILHVLPAFQPEAAATADTADTSPTKAAASDLFTAGNGPAGGLNGRAPAGNILLQPGGTEVIEARGQTSARIENKALVLAAANPGNQVYRETEALPAWNIAVDMTRRRGLGLWITGDNSGALLLVKLGRRDYVVPIDFTGRRYMEIPNGEVSWASSGWGWRMETKSTDYSKVRRIQIGFAQLPPGGKAAVTVEQLTALGELPVPLKNPVVHLGAGQLRVLGTIANGEFVQYAGGDKAMVYDENWRRRAELSVEQVNYLMPSGEASVSVMCDPAEFSPWLDVQFITVGAPLVLSKK